MKSISNGGNSPDNNSGKTETFNRKLFWRLLIPILVLVIGTVVAYDITLRIDSPKKEEVHIIDPLPVLNDLLGINDNAGSFFVFIYENKNPYNLKSGEVVKFLHCDPLKAVFVELKVHIVRNPTNIISDGNFFLTKENAIQLGLFSKDCKKPGIFAVQFQIIKSE